MGLVVQGEIPELVARAHRGRALRVDIDAAGFAGISRRADGEIVVAVTIEIGEQQRGAELVVERHTRRQRRQLQLLPGDQAPEGPVGAAAGSLVETDGVLARHAHRQVGVAVAVEVAAGERGAEQRIGYIGVVERAFVHAIEPIDVVDAQSGCRSCCRRSSW
jgi:hypothetical protein